MALPLLAFLAIPFIYNSCQAGLFGRKGFAAAKATCSVGLYKGALAKLTDQSGPDPFSAGKVQLSSVSSNAVAAKPTAPVVAKAGKELGVVIDNACLQNNKDNLASTVMSKIAAASGQLRSDL